MITMKLARVQRQEMARRTVIVLVDEQRQKVLSLWFMNPQDFGVQMYDPTAPFATDVIVDILQVLEVTLEQISIDVLQEDLLYAKLYLHNQNSQHTVKAPLNNALPLALRLNCPFTVAEEVFDRMAVDLADKGETLEKQIDAVINGCDTTFSHDFQQRIVSKIPRNLDFSEGLRGWQLGGLPLPKHDNYAFDTDIRHASKTSLAITLPKATPFRPGALTPHVSLTHERFLAEDYRGQRIRMNAYAKAEDVKHALFHLNVHGQSIEPDRTSKIQYTTDTSRVPIEGTSDWTRYELVINVPKDAISIYPSFSMQGQGKVWLDGIQFETVDTSVPLTGTRITPPPQQPQNLDFEHGLEAWDLVGSHPQDYKSGIDRTTTFHTAPSAYLKAAVAEPRGFAILQQSMNTFEYQGKRVRLSGKMKASDVEQKASLYLHMVGFNGISDGMEQTIQGTTDWSHYDIILTMLEKIAWAELGLRLHGKGQVWLTDVQLEVVDEVK